MVLSSSEFSYDPSAWDGQIQYILGFEDSLEQEMLDIAARAEVELESIYRTAPPRGSEKFIWSSDPEADKRARGWWFANIKEGNIPTDGRHYRRQGKPPYGAMIDVSRDAQNIIVIEIRQEWDKAKYVFGTLANQGSDTRVIGHRTTGWNAAKPEVDLLSKTILDQAIEGILARFGRL